MLKGLVVRKSTYGDIQDLVADIRPEDAAEVAAASGRTPTESLMDGLLNSQECWTARNNRQDILAMGGVVWHQEYSVGIPWMLCSVTAEKHKLSLVKLMKRLNARWIKHYERLYNTAWVHNPMHVAIIKSLGYQTKQEGDWVKFYMEAPCVTQQQH